MLQFNLGGDPFPRKNARYGIEGVTQGHRAAGLAAGG